MTELLGGLFASLGFLLSTPPFLAFAGIVVAALGGGCRWPTVGAAREYAYSRLTAVVC